MDPHLCVGVDVGCKLHRVGIADPDGQILEEFDVPHSSEGFDHFFSRVERHREALGLPVAVAMEGFNGYARPLDRLVQEFRGQDTYFLFSLRPGRRFFNIRPVILSGIPGTHTTL